MLVNVGDLLAFQTFLRLAAGRTGQLVNLSSLGADAGVSHGTARSWLSVLEAGYLVWRLPPFHTNVSKRLIRTPKLHFLDSGLVCYLLGIRSPEHLREHPLRGAVFETWVASEILKARAHRGLDPSLLHFRDRKGGEVDVVIELGRSLVAVEAKSGQTLAGVAFSGLARFETLVASTPTPRPVRKVLVYGGADEQKRSGGAVVPWSELDSCNWW